MTTTKNIALLVVLGLVTASGCSQTVGDAQVMLRIENGLDDTLGAPSLSYPRYGVTVPTLTWGDVEPGEATEYLAYDDVAFDATPTIEGTFRGDTWRTGQAVDYVGSPELMPGRYTLLVTEGTAPAGPYPVNPLDAMLIHD